jgi:uncharacterized protein
LKAKYGVGDTTLSDIINELKKPNRDPREDFPKPVLQKGVVKFEDLSEGMLVTGKVKNVVDFGAFVDIGIKESALIHVSELSDRFVRDPMEELKVGDVREFRIISIDTARRRIGLSLKAAPKPERQGAAPRRVVVRKADSLSNQRHIGDRSGVEARPSGRRPETEHRPDTGRGEHRSRTVSAPRREDDGMTYNPFADLLKNHKK